MPGASDAQRGDEGLQAGFEPSAAERRKGGSALEDHHVRGTVSETGLQIVTEVEGLSARPSVGRPVIGWVTPALQRKRPECMRIPAF
ncbi:hypothetical protein XHC_0769 [Xanthomonas hortorum pv. carotae str. M081]|nr:hypothetical protein XHC_0769 [Xanthomonas hortorum pv. carotae str. M081]